MTSSSAYEPLRAAPPLDGQRRRFALLLQLKDAVHTARDAAAVATSKAAAFLARLATRLHLQTPLGWVRRTASRVLSTATLLARSLGRTGAAAAAVAVVTSPTGRSALRPLVAAIASATRRGTRTAARSVDCTLRLCGSPGHQAANHLGAQRTRVQVQLDELLASLTTGGAGLLKVDAPPARLVAGLARSYLLHLALRATIRNTAVRLLVEGVVIPLVVSSRLGRWPERPAGPDVPDQPPTGPAAPKAGPAAGPERRPADLKAADPQVTELPTLPAEDDGLAAPEPVNRAERRAQQRQQARNRRTPRPT